jgi:precorrin-2 dehydrogenase/sirohydrochlorin ferrochelatase/precorrin-6A/cobalt-precorrin-6A reductase
VEILKKNNEKALLTIGSKELESFTEIQNFRERFFIRILPMEDSLKKALALGFPGSNIICMQGPFDKEMNAATLKMTGAKFLVTKDSGDTGGFEEKVSAALSLCCDVIVVARPVEEEGFTFDELLVYFGIDDSPKDSPEQRMFPLFVDMNGRMVLVIGGGKVAERRIKILADFGPDIYVIAPVVTEYIERAALLKTIRLHKRKYKKEDIADIMPFLVIAATDERKVNHQIMTEARALGIQVSVADNSKECTCYFPAIAENKKFIAALVSKNGDHSGLKEMAKKTRELFDL